LVAIVHLAPDALTDPPSLATLRTLAAADELVLVCGDGTIMDGLLPRMRAELPRRQIVAMLVYGEIQHHEQALVEELLDEGKVPLILAFDSPLADRRADWSWLSPDRSVALPEQAAGARTRSHSAE
jgi:hypothetical protein